LLEKKKKRKREKWWAVAAGKREGEISRGRMENDGRPSDASDFRLEAFLFFFSHLVTYFNGHN
jgi:hypothetical protein